MPDDTIPVKYQIMQRGVVLFISDIVHDNRTIPFMLGMGIEAAGLAIQYALGYPTSPVLDVVTIGVIVIVIAYFQRKKRVQQITN